MIASIEKEAKIKSDAAGVALLSELVEESNKDTMERSDSTNQSEKKMKNKKRTKQKRKMNKWKVDKWLMLKFVYIYHHYP